MTASPSAASVRSTSVPIWRMPISLESYPHRDPWVTDEEAALMKRYTQRANGVTGGLATAILANLNASTGHFSIPSSSVPHMIRDCEVTPSFFQTHGPNPSGILVLVD